MRVVMISDAEDTKEKKKPAKKSGSSTKEVMTVTMEQCEAMEKKEDNPGQINCAGMMGAFMKSMMRSKKE